MGSWINGLLNFPVSQVSYLQYIKKNITYLICFCEDESYSVYKELEIYWMQKSVNNVRYYYYYKIETLKSS